MMGISSEAYIALLRHKRAVRQVTSPHEAYHMDTYYRRHIARKKDFWLDKTLRQ
jgi:hypothetical protein